MSGPRDAGWAALLAGLPAMTPSRLTRLLDLWPPEEAWGRVTTGRLSAVGPVADGTEPPPSAAVLDAWRARAAGDPAAEHDRHEAAGVDIVLRDDPRYPLVLLEDLAPPPVLFVQGSLAALAAPRVAIVGTRRCTGAGAAVARSLGRDLAAAGVVVVSGLALGIDGAAHRGALQAGEPAGDGTADPGPPVGVIGCGHDRPYPRRHAALWRAVAERGALLGEAPLGVGPAAWRFPSRNRVIAALADLVVVVESHDVGGSLLTVRAAIDRDRDVLAVPGSVHNPAAAGTNQLLAEGCHPVLDAEDVLVALGLVPGGRRRGAAPARRSRTEGRPALDPATRAVLDAFDWEPATLEHLALRTGRSIPELALALERLEAGGWVSGAGPWYERVGER